MSANNHFSGDQVPKHIKLLIRELAGEAYEAELHTALEPLSEAFDKWKQDKLDSGTLSDHIHQFHQGAVRDLFVRYQLQEPAVARAIAKGILDKSTIPSDILEYLSASIKYFEKALDESVADDDGAAAQQAH